MQIIWSKRNCAALAGCDVASLCRNKRIHNSVMFICR